jgi:hypothetical protein
MLAVDPPWRQGNLSYWSHRAGIEQNWQKFVEALCQVIAASKPKLVYLKTGIPDQKDWIKALNPSSTSYVAWETEYYAGRNAQLLVKLNEFEIDLVSCPQHVDSKKATDEIAEYAYGCGVRSVADLCLGKGKMLKKFQKAGMRVCGIELHPDRAAEAAKRLGVA